MKNKIKALAKHLGCKQKEIQQSSYDENIFETGDYEEYLVVTDDEADQLWDEDLDHYIEEIIYPQFDSISLSDRYFDEETWKEDARQDGRGQSLSGYDGLEHSVEVGEDTFYIYRRN